MQYEIINKTTAEVYPVTAVSFGEADVTVTTELGDIVFSNIGQVGDLQNDTFAIREVGTHLEADGTGTVEVGPSTVEAKAPVENSVETATE